LGVHGSATPGAARHRGPGARRGAARTHPAPEPEPEPEAPPLDLRRDLAARLTQQFNPVSPVEASSLAVVTVTSELGAGSGFFVTDAGLLLTNRHVVRPPPDWAADQEAALAELKAQLDALERRLSLPRDRYSDPQNYDRGRRLLRERGREYRDAKRELEIKRNAALLQRAFEIQLKDGERLTAELLDESAVYDLALLRVSGYRTPFIRPLLGARLRQTQTVYAIGSPLGISDTVTAGTYTGKREEMLVTDARIMPGNSGGPLVTEQGFVVGVNTWKATPGPDAKQRGFGISIPIDFAFREFADLHAWRDAAGTDGTAAR
jgi:serine protease Do